MFFTKEDDRAKIQGSRDPLGVQPIWSYFGRRLVANLTTVTTSIRGFTTLLLGRYLAEKAIEERRATDRDSLGIFLRTEQLCAYARHTGPDKVEGDIRGIERVKAFVEENNGKVIIDDAPSCMILSDQKTYGLWGLYSGAARLSGLLPAGPVGLLSLGREFVNSEYWPRLQNVEKELLKNVTKRGIVNVLGDPVQSLGKILRRRLTATEIAFYSEYLRDAAGAQDRHAVQNQATLSRLIREHLDPETLLDRKAFVELWRRAKDVDLALAEDLGRILVVESVLAPAGVVFDFLQTQNHQKVGDIARRLDEEWPNGIPNISLPDLSNQLPQMAETSGAKISEIIKACAEAMGGQDYGNAVSLLIKWNEAIMEKRGTGPWILEKSGRLDVRYRGEGRELPEAEALPDLWRNSYFIDALFTITWQLEDDQ